MVERSFEVKFPVPVTIEEALRSQTFYYDYTEYPYDPTDVAEALNAYFQETEGWNVQCFRPGRPRVAGEMAVACFWPKWRKERKPIKDKLQQGVTLVL